MDDDIIVARVQLPRPLWAWVRGQALLEGLTSGKLLEQVIQEYRAKKQDEQYRKVGKG